MFLFTRCDSIAELYLLTKETLFSPRHATKQRIGIINDDSILHLYSIIGKNLPVQ